MKWLEHKQYSKISNNSYLEIHELFYFCMFTDRLILRLQSLFFSAQTFLPVTPQKYSECLPDMIAKGEKASINSLVWRLQETLDLLRPAQEQREAPPEPTPPFAGH